MFQTSINVHQNSINKNHLKDEETGDYVMIINSRKQKQTRVGRRRTAGGGGGGGRSSSGNWSAATSDLVHSSPTSSLTGIRPTSYLAQCVSPLNGPMSPNADSAPVLIPNATGNTRNKMTLMSNGNDEVESVYSVDNDGYFTSMHTDSGLYFGTFTLDTAPPFGSHYNNKLRSTGTDKFGRKALLNRFERIQEEPSYSSESLNPWNRNSQSSLTNGKTTTSSPKTKSSLKKQIVVNELGSNDSINSILSASDVTSIAVDPDDDGHHEETDFDCSVSHCSHQWHHHNTSISSPVKRLQKLTKPNEMTNGKMQTIFGTSLVDGETKVVQSHDAGQHTNNNISRHRKHSSPKTIHQDKNSRIRGGKHTQHSHSIQKEHERYLNRTLTDSSSNSSSCRRLPPPPPPPRVSSQLATLQRYVDEAAAVATMERAKQNQKTNLTAEVRSLMSSVATLTANSEINNSQANDTAVKDKKKNDLDDVTNHNTNGSVCQSESETNSEYLHASRSEHRRRLFLDVDSTRSYPPLSFIPSYDQTDTATSVSASSSAAYFEDDEFEFIDGSTNKAKDAITKTEKTPTSTDGSSTTIDGAGSSRTLTPVTTQQIETPINSPKLVNKMPVTTTVVTTSTITNLDRDRYFSSPLPPPKLDSFTMDPRSMKRITTDLNTTKMPEVVNKSPPTPAPRNSLHSTSEAIEAELDKIISQTSEKLQSSKELSPKHVRISPTVEVAAVSSLGSPKSISSISPKKNSKDQRSNQKGLSTEQMLILLHNSKKKHNIKTQPEKDLTCLRSPTSPRAQPVFPNGKTDNSTILSPLNNSTSSDMKRRSWTDGNHFGSLNRDKSSLGANKSNNENQPRTRQSLALDRLGPIRPTTLSDFKRLLSQVRSSPTSPPTLNTVIGSPSKSSSIYSALQEVLTKPNAQVSPSSSNSTSGVFSPSSPPSITGSLDECEDTTNSPIVSPKATSNGSMNEFIKKFSKSKFLNKTLGQEKVGNRLSAVSRLDTISACPTILEDDPISSEDTKMLVEKKEDIVESKKVEDIECTNTWV